ncbi:hypothetical protein HHX47_DHR6000296 [Lentinula edodes]|nr:hypothetical protein HHX47_DHR6000296 [Lentinula edodes]
MVTWAKGFGHTNYGNLYRGDSTRKGTVVFLNQIIKEATTVMHEQMQKNERKIQRCGGPGENFRGARYHWNQKFSMDRQESLALCENEVRFQLYSYLRKGILIVQLTKLRLPKIEARGLQALCFSLKK